ncbi:MAG: AAA family ATPase [Candidatus Delongbacteria bacterium]|nr:AAA family ATPase [Candidatus Delongbacteria bacterium]
MILAQIQIENFRSIKDDCIIFDHNCMILLGKNEAGKSNVLKAIAAVFNEYSVSIKDRRKRIDNEKIGEYYVRAIFKLEQKDFEKIIDRFNQSFQNTEVITFKNGKSLLDYIKTTFAELLIQINIDNDEKPYLAHWKFDENSWKLVNPVFLNDNKLTLESGEEISLKVHIFNIIEEIYKEQAIKCNYWQYKEDFLLPATVSISKFIENPSNQKALENVFILCKRENISQEFTEAMQEDGDYSNLLEQVSKTTTKVFHGIWKDFKQTSISLIPNGEEEILIKVVNKTKYSFEDRSDGFKKFISILLMLSTQSRSNRLDNHNIILIDEPDQSLYPTSARYLRDELLKIAEKAIVIYTTHSQYMIDSPCIDRHLIVEKIDDITTLKKQDSNAPFSDDELLRNAIGTSIFECLQPINIIFEGYLDKQLFDKYCNYYHEKSFKKYGQVYLRGILGLEALVQLLILANKKFLIVADSDKTSLDKRKDFEEGYPDNKKCWISYGEIVNVVSTMEDFFPVEYVSSTIDKYGISSFSYDKSKNAIQNIEKATSQDKKMKQEIKNNLVNGLKKTLIKPEYSTFIDALRQKLGEL